MENKITSSQHTEMPDLEVLFDLADLFKVFGDSTRIKILTALSYGELCVCDISTAVGMTNSAVSHQLRILKQARLVQYRREGIMLLPTKHIYACTIP